MRQGYPGHVAACASRPGQRDTRHVYSARALGTCCAVHALILVDMQRDFFNAEPLRTQAAPMVQRANELVRRAAEVDAPVVLVRTLHSPDGATWALNMSEDGQGVAIAGTEGAELLEGLSSSDAIEVHKTRDSAFVGTDLEATLRCLGVDRLVLGGVSTEACVAMTAADAYARDFRVVIAGDVVASAQREAHRAALDWLESQYRQPTRSNDQIEFAPSHVPG